MPSVKQNKFTVVIDPGHGGPDPGAIGIGDYENVAREKGFLMVSASPLTRSSYHADKDFERLKIARQKLMAT